VGFIELKAPGKGADPRKFKDPHDQAQWEKLHSLPNLLYTDGNAFSLWQDGELVNSVVTLLGDIESAGPKLRRDSSRGSATGSLTAQCPCCLSSRWAGGRIRLGRGFRFDAPMTPLQLLREIIKE
jgi:hypothetical protein